MPADPALGHNRPPDFARQVTDQMARDYAALSDAVGEQTLEASTLSATAVADEDDLEKFSSLVVRLRDTSARAKSAHDAEKEPYLRAGQAIDGFFFNLMEAIKRATVPLSQRVNDYQLQKVARERARRERERLEAERREREALEEAERSRRAAEAAERKAETAKKDHELKREKAIDALATAQAAAAQVPVAVEKAQTAQLEAARPASQLARSRFDEGRLVTMKKTSYAEIIDPTALDPAVLWPYIPLSAKETALRQWAKATGHQRNMPGARIGIREDSVIR